jgi:hypothetical protein
MDGRVYHIFWNGPGADRPTDGLYDRQEHRPETGIFMLFNGREDLAGAVVGALMQEIEREQRPPLRLGSGVGLVALAHLVLRFARELTHDVGPPFYAHVIDPENHIVTAELPEWQPLIDPTFAKLTKFVQEISELREILKLRP